MMVCVPSLLSWRAPNLVIEETVDADLEAAGHREPLTLALPVAGQPRTWPGPRRAGGGRPARRRVSGPLHRPAVSWPCTDRVRSRFSGPGVLHRAALARENAPLV